MLIRPRKWERILRGGDWRSLVPAAIADEVERIYR